LPWQGQPARDGRIQWAEHNGLPLAKQPLYGKKENILKNHAKLTTLPAFARFYNKAGSACGCRACALPPKGENDGSGFSIFALPIRLRQ